MDYAERSIGDFLDAVASERVTPAGGSAAAVVGATGAALCEMVCVHTRRWGDPDADASSDLATLRDEFGAQREALLDLADADAEAVDALLAAREADGSAVTEAKRATGVPLAVAEACVAVLEGATVVVDVGTPNAVPDAVTGATLAHGALRASLFTVRTNLDGVDDASFVEETERRVAALDRNGEAAYEDATSGG